MAKFADRSYLRPQPRWYNHLARWWSDVMHPRPIRRNPSARQSSGLLNPLAVLWNWLLTRNSTFGNVIFTPGFNQITFFLFLLINVTLFLRPTDIFPDLASLPIYSSLMTVCAIGAIPQIQRQLAWQRLIQSPISMCVLGVWVAILLSHLSHFALYGVRESGGEFIKIVLYYFLIVGLVDTPLRLRRFLMTVAICANILVLMCVLDFLEIVEFEFITHIADWDQEATEDFEGTKILRMRGTGLLQDPNDISLVIAATGVICVYFLTDAKMHVVFRALWLPPLGVLATGLICTHSRGGLLACGMAGLTFLSARYSKMVGIVGGLLGICCVPLLGGRQGNIDIADGTGQDRIQLWAEGLSLLKSPDLFFGTGANTYGDLIGLVAHNSYVHAFVELGIFGGTLFFGTFFFAALGLYRLRDVGVLRANSELARLQPYMLAMLAGWSVGLLSLSRCYVAFTYLLLGTIASYLILARQKWPAHRLATFWNKPHVTLLVMSSGTMLVGLFVFCRLFAHWGR